MSKIKNWISGGTGSYEVKEIALAQGDILSGWDSVHTQVNITGGTITFNGDSTSSNINLIKNNFFTLGKKYKIRFRTVSSSTSTGSTFGLRYWNAPTETTKDDSGNSLIDEGWHTLEGVYLYAGSGSLRLQIAFVNSSDGDELVIDNLSVTEIPPLPEITTGTKYIQCTSNGTIIIPADLDSFIDNGYIYIDRWDGVSWTTHKSTVDALKALSWFDYSNKKITLTGTTDDRFANIKIYNGVKQ